MMHGDEAGHMSGWFGFGHGLFGWIFWLVLILLIAALIKYLLKK